MQNYIVFKNGSEKNFVLLKKKKLSTVVNFFFVIIQYLKTFKLMKIINAKLFLTLFFIIR